MITKRLENFCNRWSLLATAAVLLLPGCDGILNRGKATTEEEDAEKKVEVVWDWKSYERDDELVLGRMQVGMQPKQTVQLKSEGSGLLTVNLEKDTVNLPKGFEWAKMDVEELSEQALRKEIKERQQEIEKKRQDELDLPEKRKQAREDLAEAGRKLRLMKAVMESPALRDLSTELFGGDVTDVNEKTLKQAQADYDLAVKKWEFLEKFEERLLTDKEILQKLDNKNADRSLEEARDRSVYTLPFEGELKTVFDFVRGQKEYTVAAREVLATLSDYSEVHGYLVVKNSPWINLKPESLKLKLQDKDKTTLPFIEDKIVIDERTKGTDRVYVFGVPLEGNEGLKRLSGAQMNADLVVTLTDKAYIVPKYDLSLYALGKTKTLDWAEMVDDLWPGAKVLAEGLSSVAIDYKP